MLAYVLGRPGAAPEFRELAKPSPSSGELLIRVQATSVNPVDDLVASGFFSSTQDYRYPAVFGRDLCGVVEAVGVGVEKFTVGDCVWGFIKRDHVGDGTFAEYVTCAANRFVVRKPDALSVVEAGAAGLAAVTGLECVDRLALSAGDTIFVNRATGGVGTFAVQVAVARGLRVIATARPGPASDLVRRLGAAEVVDWTIGDVVNKVHALAPDGVAGIVDLVRRGSATSMGKDESSSQSAVRDMVARILRSGGRFTSVTNGADHDQVERGIGINVHSEPTIANLDELNRLAEQGRLRVPVTHTYPFNEITRAFEQLRTAALGKIAVVLDPILLEQHVAPDTAP